MWEQTKCHLQLPALQPSLAQDPVSACLWQDRWTGLSLGCNCSSRCSQGPILRTRHSLSPPEPIEATRIRCCLHSRQKPKPITPWWTLWCEVAGEKPTHIHASCPNPRPASLRLTPVPPSCWDAVGANLAGRMGSSRCLIQPVDLQPLPKEQHFPALAASPDPAAFSG